MMIQSMLRCRTPTVSGRYQAPRTLFTVTNHTRLVPSRFLKQSRICSIIPHVRSFSSEQKTSSSSSSSDARYESTGEYDTQEKGKRIGNPIQWANPYDGPTVEDGSNPKLQWVLPVGCAFILAFVLWSRLRKKSSEEDEDLIGAPKMQQYDMSHHSTPTFSPTFSPPPSSSSPGGGWTPSPPPSS